MKQIIQAIKNGSMFWKIIFLFEVILLTSVIIMGLLLSNRYANVIKEKDIVLGEIKVEQLQDYINEKYNRVYGLANHIHNSELVNRIKNISEDDGVAYDYNNISYFDTFFASTLSADKDISDVLIVTTNGYVYSDSRDPLDDVNPGFDFNAKSEVIDIRKEQGSLSIFRDNPSTYCIRQREDVITFLGNIYRTDRLPQKTSVGVYIINIPVSRVEEAINARSSGIKGELTLRNEDNHTLYSTILNEDSKVLENQPEEEDVYRKNQPVGNTGLTVEYSLSNILLFEEINHLLRWTVVLMLIVIAITIMVGYIIYQTYQKRISILLKAMHKVEKGSLEEDIPVTSKDEIGIISQSFNTMCHRLNDYIDRVYKSELEQKAAEIDALEMQINPHFLYNTLESIKATALEEGDRKTPEMISLLGKLFQWSRYTDEKFVTIEQEMDYIKTYLNLQSYRYDDQIEIDIKIDEENLDYMIPKLTLQPLVENIIHHGFGKVKRPGLVGITVKLKDKHIEITVYDNGIGMSKQALEGIRKQLDNNANEPVSTHIGIQNIHNRIRLLFGDSYGIRVESVPLHGTAVKVILPAIEEGEVSWYVQTYNR